MASNFFRSQLKATDVPVTARQLTQSEYTAERGDDEGIFLCKAVYPYFEFDADGKQTQKQAGWSYQCQIPARDSLTIFVKVNDLNCVVTDSELKSGPVPIQFTAFRGVWWVNKRGYQELSCKAELAERVQPAEVQP